MKAKSIFYFYIFVSLFTMHSCIKDDIVDDRVDPVVRITNQIDSLSVDSTYQLKAIYLNEVGQEMGVDFDWTSTNESILSVNATGTVKGLQTGSAWIKTSFHGLSSTVSDSSLITVDSSVVVQQISKADRTGRVETTSSYPLTGSYTLQEVAGGIRLSLGADYKADNSLPGLYVYLSNNNSTIEFAYEIGAVKVFEGAHTYFIPNVDINQYSYILYFCKPFNVKVGDGVIN